MSSTSKRMCTHTYTKLSTDPNQLIHRLIHSPRSQQDTKPHTAKNAYRYLAGGRPRHIPGHRGGCLAWGGCRRLCWRECSTLDHTARTPSPHWMTLGNRGAGQGMYRARCVAYAVLLLCRRGVVALGNGESRPGGWPALGVRLGGRCAGGAL